MARTSRPRAGPGPISSTIRDGRSTSNHVSDCYAPRTGGIESQVSAVAAQRVAAAFRTDVAVVPNGIDLGRWASLPSRARRGALPGRVPREVLRAAYGDADVFLAPASLESFGLAALEARTAGLAVLARRVAGVEEFVADGVGGFLVDDDRAMAEALVRRVRETGLLVAIRSHNRDVRPRFGWDEVLATVDAEYRRAAALGTVEARAAL